MIFTLVTLGIAARAVENDSP